eukprot:2176338-Rhodomonas_salina.1
MFSLLVFRSNSKGLHAARNGVSRRHTRVPTPGRVRVPGYPGRSQGIPSSSTDSPCVTVRLWRVSELSR